MGGGLCEEEVGGGVVKRGGGGGVLEFTVVGWGRRIYVVCDVG